jgi:hypothetical protein
VGLASLNVWGADYFFGVAFLYWGTRVRDHDFEHNIATLNVEAGGARERAGKLEERAAGLEKEAEQAREGIATANAETARANESAAKANERTAELKLALEREIAARQPRTITPEQHSQIVAYLNNVSAPKGEIIVLWKLFDEEAEKFAKQVIAVLKDAGFDTKQGDGPMTFGERGAWIVVRDLQRYKTTPTAIGAIQGAFRDILHVQLDGSQRTDPFPDLGEVVIAIGAKPF